MNLCLAFSIHSLGIGLFLTADVLSVVAPLLEVSIVDDLDGRHDENDDEEVYGHDDRSEDTEPADRSDVRCSIRQKCNCGCARSDCDGAERPLEGISHSEFLIFGNHGDEFRLPPGVTEDEDVVSGNAKYYEDR